MNPLGNGIGEAPAGISVCRGVVGGWEAGVGILIGVIIIPGPDGSISLVWWRSVILCCGFQVPSVSMASASRIIFSTLSKFFLRESYLRHSALQVGHYALI